MWANGQLAIQAQVTRETNWDSENFYQNRGESLVFKSDRWYCIEVFVKLNTPAVADGQLAAVIDAARLGLAGAPLLELSADLRGGVEPEHGPADREEHERRIRARSPYPSGRTHPSDQFAADRNSTR